MNTEESIKSGEELSEMTLRTLTYIGSNVKFIRKSLLDMKLNPMAELTGVSRDVLCRLEALSSGEGSMGKGRVYPSIPTIIKFCESTGVELSEIMTVDVSVDSNIQSRVVRHCGAVVDKFRGLEVLDSSDNE